VEQGLAGSRKRLNDGIGDDESSELAALTTASASRAALATTDRSASVPSTGSIPRAFSCAALSGCLTRPST
jgi:hypothetical protein